MLQTPKKAKISEFAQGVLDARALYPDSSLAELYDPLTMPPPNWLQPTASWMQR